MKTTERFTNKAKFYHSSRPSYPKEILINIEQKTNISVTKPCTIADIGSGTGKLSEIFLAEGFKVLGVEPNMAMREVAEKELRKYKFFVSIDGSAEYTGIDNHSIDLIVVGQSFHWFNLVETRKEFLRILKPDSYVCIVWNNRNTKQSLFFRDYELLLDEFGTDYQEVSKNRIEKKDFEEFYGVNNYQRHLYPNRQKLDFQGVKGRILSTSYMIGKEDTNYPKMIKKLQIIFHEHQKDGFIDLNYETEMYIGKMISNSQ